MSSKRYTEEFKIEAVKQVTECGYSASEVARRLGVVNAHSLYAWIKECLTNRGRFMILAPDIPASATLNDSGLRS